MTLQSTAGNDYGKDSVDMCLWRPASRSLGASLLALRVLLDGQTLNFHFIWRDEECLDARDNVSHIFMCRDMDFAAMTSPFGKWGTFSLVCRPWQFGFAYFGMA